MLNDTSCTTKRSKLIESLRTPNGKCFFLLYCLQTNMLQLMMLKQKYGKFLKPTAKLALEMLSILEEIITIL